jgi:hypothetical protein
MEAGKMRTELGFGGFFVVVVRVEGTFGVHDEFLPENGSRQVDKSQ